MGLITTLVTVTRDGLVHSPSRLQWSFCINFPFGHTARLVSNQSSGTRWILSQPVSRSQGYICLNRSFGHNRKIVSICHSVTFRDSVPPSPSFQYRLRSQSKDCLTETLGHNGMIVSRGRSVTWDPLSQSPFRSHVHICLIR